MSLHLMAHQVAAVEFLEARGGRGALFADPGTGKTIATLAYCDRHPTRTLVVAPVSVMRNAWASDARHFPDFIVRTYHGPKAKRRAELAAALEDGDRSILLTSFETFRGDAAALADFARRTRLVVDESSKMKNRAAATTKALILAADAAREVVLLSGTPAPNGPDEYWPQLRAIDPDLASPPDGPPIFFAWASRYLRPIMQSITVKGRPRRVVGRYVVPADREADFTALLDSAALRVAKRDCLDLPEKTHAEIRVELESERDAADDVLEGFVRDVDGGERVEVAGRAAGMKLRQIAGGNVHAGEGRWIRVGDAKLRALADLDEQLAGEPYLVWTQFRVEADRVIELLEGRGRRVARADGAGNAADAVEAFVAGEADVLVAHPASVGHGVTCVTSGSRPCSVAVFFSPGYSYEQTAQAEDRIHRKGQRSACTYYHLVADGSVDDAVRGAVRRKASAADAVMDRLREMATSRRGCTEADPS